MNKKRYWQLFIATFSISAFTFGGGYVIIPLMQKKFSKDLKWIKEEEILSLVAIAQSAPGPVAVNMSILVGYRIGGYLGCAIAVIATVLPPLITLSIISVFYNAFRENLVINLMLRAMRVCVAAIIFDVVIKMIMDTLKDKNFPYIGILIASFIAVYFFKINIALVILFCILVGIGNHKHKQKKENNL